MFTEIVEGDYIVRTYASGTIVKTLVGEETAGEVIELPPNPLNVLKEENAQLKLQIESTNQQLAQTNADMAELMNYIIGA